MYPKSCTCCEEAITEPLYEFGDHDTPMCQSCHLALLDEPMAQPIYYHMPIIVDGKQIGHTTHLTALGVVFFDGHGIEGQHLTTVLYGSGKDTPDA
jgi:hypothetical protein